jgi:hypothetical protein
MVSLKGRAGNSRSESNRCRAKRLDQDKLEEMVPPSDFFWTTSQRGLEKEFFTSIRTFRYPHTHPNLLPAQQLLLSVQIVI